MYLPTCLRTFLCVHSMRIKAQSTITVSKAFTVALRLSALRLVNKHNRSGSGGFVCGGAEVWTTAFVVKKQSDWCRSVSIIDSIQGSLRFTNIVVSGSNTMLATPVKTTSLIIVTCLVNNSIPAAQTHTRTRRYNRHFNKGTYIQVTQRIMYTATLVIQVDSRSGVCVCLCVRTIAVEQMSFELTIRRAVLSKMI